MDNSSENSHYNIIKYENIKTIDIYNTFINWVRGEFDLYLMEERDELKVYYPNGWFSIKVLSENEKELNIIIQIKSKTLDSGLKINAQINKIYSHLNQIFK
ncbi:MAG: hypothetical protein ACYC01_03835 [Lutibacter sp.]